MNKNMIYWPRPDGERSSLRQEGEDQRSFAENKKIFSGIKDFELDLHQILYDTTMAIQKAQAACSWNSEVSDALEYVHKARHLAN